METFEAIEVMRNKNGFSSGNYPKYKNYLRIEMRKTTCKETRNMYKLESNLSKFLIFDSTEFLKSSLRMLKKDKSEFSMIYTNLIAAIKGHVVGKPVRIEILFELREIFLPFKSFLDQVNSLLESSSYSFDISSLKVKYAWHDVEVGFNTISERDEFLQKKVAPQGDEYDTILSRHILLVEKKEHQLLSLIGSKPDRIICINKKIEKPLEALDSMKIYYMKTWLILLIYIRWVGKQKS